MTNTHLLATFSLVALGLACTTTETQQPAATSRRARPQITTPETFDAKSVPVYTGAHDATYAYIDRNIAAHVENLRRWVRQRSISAQNDGIAQMAEMVRKDLLALGFKEAEVVPTTGHPGVWGYYNAGAEKTLAVYMMYDVQPVEPTGWQVNAFAGELVDHPLGRVLMARGATNQKGPERAFLNALEAIIKSGDRVPVNLMVLAEGEEELGSPNYPELIDRFADRLRTASGVVFPMHGQGPDGSVGMTLGVKGILYMELEARGNERGGPKTAEIHSSLKAITDSPVWRLTHALASLTTPDGNTINVPGYYDAIRQPSLEEQRLVNGMLASWTRQEAGMRQAFGVDRWIDGLSGRESLLQYLFGTSLNIDGIWSGYTGPGTKTILPHIATAKVDTRLVPNQTPEEALRLIRAHLDRQGFTDIAIRR